MSSCAASLCASTRSSERWAAIKQGAAFSLAATIVLSTTAARAEARTVRIEPRPFYGATVTLEEGVRVFRPLPPHDRVIINPGSKTPPSLRIYESNSYNANYNYNYDGGFAAVPTSAAATSASSPAESNFAGIASGTKVSSARFAARNPKTGGCRAGNRSLVGRRGKG